MVNKEEKEDDCSYISRIHECTPGEVVFGIVCFSIAALILCLVFLSCGCSSCYVASLRSEFSDNGKVEGIYRGTNEYPVVYPATRIAFGVEIPHWWNPASYYFASDVELYIWPLGAVCSIADVPISLVVDTLTLPYDIMMVRNGKGNTK